MFEVLYFSAEWCGPCKSFYPIVSQVCGNTGMNLRRIDVELDLASREVYNITAVPTVIVLKNGNPVYRKTGVVSKAAFEQTLQNL